MKCSKNFIKVYNETFKFIHEKLGKRAVVKYWKRISPIVLADLRENVEQNGLFGCVKYWDDTLFVEGANYQIEYKPDTFKMTISKCPSLEILDEPYKDYCQHCEVMYKPIFRALGYKYQIEKGEEGCRITVSR